MIDPRAVSGCVRCGTCRSVCPVFQETGWESSGARGKMLVLKSMTEGANLDSWCRDSLGTCTTCALCTQICPAAVRPTGLIEEGRRDLVLANVTRQEHRRLNRNLLRYGNTFGDGRDRLGWLGEEKEMLPKSADFVYFAGCVNSYRYPETAKKTFQILSRFSVTAMPQEMCCGSPLLRTGFDAGFLREANLEQMEAMGARAIITGCAGCYTALKGYGGLEVYSVPEFLNQRLEELDIQPLDLTVCYHDPCHLGRHQGVYDPPRRILEAICSLVEMKASREKARCCGGGGGVRAAYPELSQKIARRRLLDVPAEADAIVTACPLCVRNLRDAGGNAIDLIDLVSRALPPSL
ncbi:MAG TPA: (Fe-S)-binding protein [Methanotrichaceae archaeon]|nr:(Fe-S)-binding protein [Methanotrichaceae archaeon]HQF16189.1 (Fe-S)-binding protein [Methanotrichaceae archaeon]HQI90925.1 (Fe-S)-binding protein [Methanotrichaceae archaeon]HQJ28347.1 (Fe-S)-binding protein [Methanotrichaceae archaeon]